MDRLGTHPSQNNCNGEFAMTGFRVQQEGDRCFASAQHDNPGGFATSFRVQQMGGQFFASAQNDI